MNSTFCVTGIKESFTTKNPINEIMNNPEELEKMVLESSDDVSVVINKNFIINDEKPIAITGSGNKLMLSKKVVGEKKNILKEKTEDEPGVAEIFEEVEYSNDDFYKYIECMAKDMGFADEELVEFMAELEDQCPRISFKKIAKRKITI